MSDENTQPENPFTRRGFIAAAIVIGVIFLAGVIVLVTSLTAPKDDNATAPPTTNTGDPVASGDDRSVCGLEGYEEESTLTEAPETDWELVGTVAVPAVGNSVGPGEVSEEGLRTCYAHTAEGALFAIVNYIAMSSDARTLPLIPELVAPGPGRDAAEAANEGEQPSSSRLQVAGFKVNSYSADEAVIDVVWSVTSASGQLVSFPMVMQWTEGDWKISLTDDGALPFTSSPIDSLGGYIPWAGV